MQGLATVRAYLKTTVCLLLLCLASCAAPAQTGPFSVLQNAGESATPDQIAQRPATDFVPLEPHTAYRLGHENPLWLRIDNAALRSTKPLVIDFRQPFLDRVDLYVRNAQGGWDVSSAGDWIANAQWQVPGLTPVLKLPTAQAEPGQALVKVSSMIPVQLQPHILGQEEEQKDSKDTILLVCLMMGAIALMTALSASLALTYRSAIYAWYALYTVMAFLAVGSYCGVTGFALWPQSPRWADIAVVIFILTTSITHMVFSSRLFRPSFVRKWIPDAIEKAGITMLLATPFYTQLFPRFNNSLMIDFVVWTGIFFALVTLCLVVMLGVALHALRTMRTSAVLWLLAGLPLMVSTLLSIMQHYGLIALPWLPFNAPLYALSVEIFIFQFVLQLHAKTNFSAQLVRRTLASTDPLTGFIAAPAFTKIAFKLWHEAQEEKTDLAIVYIEADDRAGHYEVGFGIDEESRLRRLVRILRAGTREQDVVAMRNDMTFAILMPGVQADEKLQQRLSRLVALGLMADEVGDRSAPIRFRIAASTLQSFDGKLSDLDNRLRNKLSQPRNWIKSPICFVWRNDESSQASLEPEQVHALQELWGFATTGAQAPPTIQR